MLYISQIQDIRRKQSFGRNILIEKILIEYQYIKHTKNIDFPETMRG